MSKYDIFSHENFFSHRIFKFTLYAHAYAHACVPMPVWVCVCVRKGAHQNASEEHQPLGAAMPAKKKQSNKASCLPLDSAFPKGYWMSKPVVGLPKLAANIQAHPDSALTWLHEQLFHLKPTWIDHLHNYIAWVRDGASGDGRSVTCIWFRCSRRAESCFSCLRFGLFWVRFICRCLTDRHRMPCSLTQAIIVQMVYCCHHYNISK